METKALERGRAEVTALCDYFRANQASFLRPDVKEAHVRQMLIDPFFEALGWDVRNTEMVAPQYRQVITEDSLDVEGHRKAPDYTFRRGTLPKFYVEAKKCCVNIGVNVAPAYQLRRYGFSAKLGLSMLTDFQEFSVYDCTIRPTPDDKASHARSLYMRFDDYPVRWPEIWNVFSWEAVESGAFDLCVASRRKRGTSEVDNEFLKDIEAWRVALAVNIASRNPQLPADDLNAAVQRIIDRIVFLRMAEDRDLEPYGQLLRLCDRPGMYGRLLNEVCRKADEKYNSGLFHLREEPGIADPPDRLTPGLIVDDETLAPIIQSLYFEFGSPYQFNVLPVEILGTVYERFLGKVICVTAEHEATVEEKPEVRKAGGVYYTPDYIVDWIVRTSMDAQVAGKSPAELAAGKDGQPLRVLDMACGSGSFLLSAYQYLLDYCLEWFQAQRPARHPRAVFRDPKGSWKLTITERKRILTTHIFGVDIDRQAMEVTNLSLLLKALEGQDDASLTTQMRLFHERALPNLSNNIKCGNSLIPPDYFLGQLSPDPDVVRRINPLNWEAEFPEAMKHGGFDVVIGNPPWVSLSGRFGQEVYPQATVRFLMTQYGGNSYMPNMYEYFVAKGLLLTRLGGSLSLIVPDRLGFNQQFRSLRQSMLTRTRLNALVYKTPFPGVTVDTLVFACDRQPADPDHRVSISEYGKPELKVRQVDLAAGPDCRFEFFEDDETKRLVAKLESQTTNARLADLCSSTSGFGGKSTLIHEHQSSDREIPVLKGDSIGRYEFRKIYWFDFRKENITGRTTDVRKLGVSPKVVLRKTGDRIVATYVESAVFPEQSLYFLFDKRTSMDWRYFLALLNSSLLTFYYRARALTNKNSIAQVKKVDLDELPIRNLDMADADERESHDRLVQFVDLILTLSDRRSRAISVAESESLGRQVHALELQVDRLVFGLYGLTPEEARFVEGDKTALQPE